MSPSSSKFLYNIIMNTLVDPDVCYFCGLKRTEHKSSRSLIELHHIVPREENGSNDADNILPVCSNHHSMIHLGMITPIRFYNSTRGIVLHWKDENGKDKYGNNFE